MYNKKKTNKHEWSVSDTIRLKRGLYKKGHSIDKKNVKIHRQSSTNPDTHPREYSPVYEIYGLRP